MARKIYNRFFEGTTAALPTLSWSGLSWRPGEAVVIRMIRIVALWIPAAGGVNQIIPNRFNLSGALNENLDNVTDGLPGFVFDPNSIWGACGEDGTPLECEYKVPAGVTLTMAGRAYCPAAAFAVGDAIDFFLQIAYDDQYGDAGISPKVPGFPWLVNPAGQKQKRSGGDPQWPLGEPS